jgi:hypothetical protein
MKKEQQKKALAKKETLDAKVATLEVPSVPKKEVLAKKEEVVYDKYTKELDETEKRFCNFELIKQSLHASMTSVYMFAMSFLTFHVKRNFNIMLDENIWKELQANVKFTSEELEHYSKHNETMLNSQAYIQTMNTLKSCNVDASKLAYDALSICRVLMRMQNNKRIIINDLQCTTMRSDDFLVANSHGTEFENRGSRIAIVGSNDKFSTLSTFRALKGKFYSTCKRETI